MIDTDKEKEPNLKNLRQMGTPAENDKIYIENAAYARIHEEDYAERRVFILMGHTECKQGKYATFAEAAIPVRDMKFEQNIPLWSTHAWADVFREIKRSYENSIIVGWVLDLKGFTPQMTPELTAVHREQFGGAHQVFLLMDSLEGEEYFYMNRGNGLQRKEGFYIYYARELHKVRPAQVTFEGPKKESFQVLPETREVKADKQKKNPKGNSKASSYAMAAAVALLVLIGGVGAAQGKISLNGLRNAVGTMGDKVAKSGGRAEVLVGSEITEEPERETQTKTEIKDTQTSTKPLELIPIEEIPAGEIRKEKDTPESPQTTDTQADTQTVKTGESNTQNPQTTSDKGGEQKKVSKETSAEPVAKQHYYTVQEGDTLSGICQKNYGNIRNLKKIVEINHMENSDDIRVGQKLLLP